MPGLTMRRCLYLGSIILIPFLILIILITFTSLRLSVQIGGNVETEFEIEKDSQEFIRTDMVIPILKKTLKEEFFGQHIAMHSVLPTLDNHLKDPNPSKPLVFSFHGSPGIGKSYMAKLIVQSLYLKGQQSKFVKFYNCVKEFTDPNKIKEYQQRIEDEIEDTLTESERSTFVFDEIDMMQPGVLDTLVAFLGRDNVYKTLNQKKALYIFLSNTGAQEISRITFAASKHDGQDEKGRQGLTHKDFKVALMNEAYNAKNEKNNDVGFTHARIIKKALIDFFVPFMPLTKEHVTQCVKAEMKRRNAMLDLKIIDEIVEDVTYKPPFALFGCQEVQSLVNYRISLQDYKSEL